MLFSIVMLTIAAVLLTISIARSVRKRAANPKKKPAVSGDWRNSRVS